MSEKHLRVALVWHGNVLQEKIMREPSSVTVGETADCMFAADIHGDEKYELFTEDAGSYTLNLRSGMKGRLTTGGNEQDISQLSGRIPVRPGDWGVIEIDQASFFFQFVDRIAGVVATAGYGGLNYVLASALAVSAVVQIAMLIYAFMAWKPETSAFDLNRAGRFVQIQVDEPPDAIEEVEEEEADDETMSQRAGGEEGKFGAEDAEVEDSTLPDHDGPMVDSLETPELGRAFEAALAQSGALSNVFGNSDAFMNSFGQDFATAGEGDAFVLGRGSGGLGMRGGGGGGGGDGFGRVHGVGDIDTGGGSGRGASLGRREAVAPRGRVSRGSPRVNGFLPREHIERVVRRHSRGIRACYERELQNDRSLAGRITVNWTIGLDGRVARSSIASNSIGSSAVESCILREVRRMRFDQPDGGMCVVSFPFTFRSAE